MSSMEEPPVHIQPTEWHLAEIGRTLRERGVEHFELHMIKAHCPGWLEYLLRVPGMGSRVMTVVVPEHRPLGSDADMEPLRAKWEYELRDVKGKSALVLRALDKL